MKTLTRAGLVVLVALSAAVAGCGGDDETDFQAVYDACRDKDGTAVDLRYLSVADDGNSLLVDGAGESGMSGVLCMLKELDAPDSLLTSMSSTTAMMGRQSEEVDGYKYEWSYHPDNGLDLVVTQAD